MNDTFLNIALVVVAAVFVLYTVRNSRKNKAKQAEAKSLMVPGVQVMTNFGLFGTLISVDEVSNQAEIEIAPGVITRVHRQTLAKVVTEADTVAGGEPRSVEEAMEIANREEEARERAAKSETPAFGERAILNADAVVVDDSTTDDEPKKKPVRRTTKKVDE